MATETSLPTAEALETRFRCVDGDVHLTGIQALVRVLVDQRRRDACRHRNTAGFVSGYPGSPLGTLDLELARWRTTLEEHDVLHVPGLNEELAATAVFGTQLVNELPQAEVDGVFAMWFGKAPGVDRATDAFRHGNYRGTAALGGVVAVAGDDPNAKSTIIPSDSNTAFVDLYMPLLYPGDVQDVVDLGGHAFELSRASGLAVGLKIVTNVADSSGTVSVSPNRVDPVVPTVMLDGKAFLPQVHVTASGQRMLPVERELVEGRLELARQYAYENGINRVVRQGADDWLGIVTAGRAYFDVRQALTDLGVTDADLQRAGIRILKLGMLYPLEPRAVRAFARDLEEILVVEDKRPFLETYVKEALYGRANAPRVVGKADDEGRELLPAYGELDADAIARAIARRISPKIALPSVAARLAYLDRPIKRPLVLDVNRGPYFCSGCPHNRSLVVPDGTVVGAGIGCHIMAIKFDRPEFGDLAGFTQMGGEGAQFVGIAPFTGTKHFVQNLGDGTMFHSGSLAIRFAIAAKLDITYKLLYNSAVGMTGGQDVTGAMPIPALVKALEAEGVRRIIVTTEDLKRYRGSRLGPITQVWHRDRLIEAQEELARTSGVTVLIHDQECAAERRRKRKRGKATTPAERLFINERVCEGCGDCGKKSNCISVLPVETEFGRKTQIHQSSCNLDFSCLEGDCPSFVTVTPRRKARLRRRVPDRSAPTALPEPLPQVPVDDFTVHMTGIGGTGVVTVNQVLATAASLGGRYVRTLDLTGSSQKAGSVVSALRVSASEQPGAAAIATGAADLYLAFDALTGVDTANLAKADPDRTIAVVSTSEVPTGKMVVDPALEYPEPETLETAIRERTRADQAFFLDAEECALRLFGDHLAANVLLVGAAFQRGALPLAADDIEQALRINGAASDRNIAAFRWGRLAVAEPEQLAAALATPRSDEQAEQRRRAGAAVRSLLAPEAFSDRVGELVARRARELVEYQNVGYARSYVDFVTSVADAERRVAPERDDLSAAVAEYLFKLMAYKDEYEVARLHLDPAARAAIEDEFGPDVKVAWNLHPPFLRALGIHHKIAFGRAAVPALAGLRAMRRIRGGPLDLFGKTELRKIERALVEHYRELVNAASSVLSAANYDDVVTLASLADIVRGYEDIKVDNTRRYLYAARDASEQLGLQVAIPAGVLTGIC